MSGRWHRALSRLPEIWIGFFGFLLHYVWEFLQVPFFEGMPEVSHWEGIRTCSQATLGDAWILLLAYWTAAVIERSRYWLEKPSTRAWLIFIGTGLVITVLLEWLATEVWDRWTYAPEMPVVPFIGTGLLPLAQWLLIPPLALWLARTLRRGLRAVRV